jgi:hypothetical protein
MARVKVLILQNQQIYGWQDFAENREANRSSLINSVAAFGRGHECRDLNGKRVSTTDLHFYVPPTAVAQVCTSVGNFTAAPTTAL